MRKEGVLVLGILLGLGLVFAVHTITLPSSSSVNEDITNLFNISVQNTDIGVDANISEVNITLWGNFDFLANSNNTDAETHTFSNTSTTLSWNGDGVVMNSTTKYFWFNATAAAPGTYNITVTTLNVTGSSETNISITVNNSLDSGDISFVAPGLLLNTNYSSTSLPVNISVNITLVVDRINITLYNSTNDLINSSMSEWGNSSYYYNFTGLSEGTYYINATVNDSANNVNYSATSQVILDTTVPVVTFACTDSAETGRTITCTCTATDTGGVGGAGVSSPTFYENPDTNTPGTIITSCSALDSAGNNGSANETYTINNAPSGGTTTGTTYTKTYALDNQEFSELGEASKELKKNEKIRIKFGGVKHNVGITAITSTKIDIEVFSTLQKASLNIGNEKMFDLNDDDIYDLKIILSSIANNKANLTLKYIQEDIPADILAEQDGSVQIESKDGDGTDTGDGATTGQGNLTWLYIIITIIIAIGIVSYFFKDKIQEILQR